VAKDKKSKSGRKSLEERKAAQANNQKKRGQSVRASLLNVAVLVAVCLFIVFFFNSPRPAWLACVVVTLLIAGLIVYGTYQRYRMGIIQSMKEWYIPFWSSSFRQIVTVVTIGLMIFIYYSIFTGKFS